MIADIFDIKKLISLIYVNLVKNRLSNAKETSNNSQKVQITNFIYFYLFQIHLVAPLNHANSFQSSSSNNPAEALIKTQYIIKRMHIVRTNTHHE